MLGRVRNIPLAARIAVPLLGLVAFTAAGPSSSEAGPAVRAGVVPSFTASEPFDLEQAIAEYDAQIAAEEAARAAEAARVEAERQAAEAEAARQAEAARAAQAAQQQAPRPAVQVFVAGDAAANRLLGQRMAADVGWTGREWECLDELWGVHESGWRTEAHNASGAHGIPQALPGSKMGPGWESDPVVQISWGLGYIASRYTTPCGADAAFHQQGWY